MKKFLVLFLALSLLGGAAFAEELGLTAGVEFHIGALNHEDVDAMDTAVLRPYLFWENSDLVENLELYAEIGIPFWMSSWLYDDLWLGVDLTLRGTYNLELSPEGTLGLILESQSFFLAPLEDYQFAQTPAFGWGWGLTNTTSWLVPGVRYTHDLGDMSVFGQLNIPMQLFYGEDSTFDHVGIDIIAGFDMNMDFGLLGVEVEFNGILTDEGDSDFAQRLTITPFIELADLPLYAELSISMPLMSDGMDWYGMTITPEVRYYVMDNLRAFFNLPIQGIASDHDVTIGLGLGVQFSF